MSWKQYIRLNRRNIRRSLLVVAVAAVASLVINIAFLFYFGVIDQAKINVPPTEEHAEVETRLPDLNAALLSDSILSIISSYYVDPERVTNAGLLRAAVLGLGEVSEVDVGELGDDHYQLKLGSNTLSVHVPADLPYKKLLDEINGITQYLAQNLPKVQETNLVERERKPIYTVLNAILNHLDAHSSLMDTESYRDLKQGTEGTFGGLGVLVGIRDQLLTVIKPMPQSPALRAGIRQQDKILSINGVNTFGYSLDELVEYMRGAPGTTVDLDILKKDEASRRIVKVRREVIKVDSVTTSQHIIDDKIVLQLVIESFSQRTSEEVAAAIQKAMKNRKQPLGGVILDLRSNPGGLLEQAVAVSNLFLESGTIVSTKGRRKEVEVATRRNTFADLPVVLLINNDSASASEIVAGALQDHGRAIVIGQPSFGKGSVQTIFELPGEQALKLTIARYYTPSGRSIQNVGITPDVWLQPVAKIDQNSNLLGSFRYKSEQFLNNHLHAGLTETSSISATNPFFAEFKGYYLASPPEQSEEKSDENANADAQGRELDLAKTVFQTVFATYNQGIPTEVNRASHLLAIAAPGLAKALNQWNEEVKTWLAEKVHVEWDEPDGSLPEGNRVTLQVQRRFPQKPVEQGDEVTFNWKVRNLTSSKLTRVTVFIGSHDPSVETQELLIGSLEPGQLRKGTISLQVPAQAEPGELRLIAGISQDALPLKLYPHPIKVVVQPKIIARVSTKFRIVDEQGGKVAGVLEANENAKIEVILTNDGNIPARTIDFSLKNLSGKQIWVFGDKQVVGDVLPGESRAVRVPIEAKDRLYRSTLDLGLTLSSRDLLGIRRESIVLNAKPTETGHENVSSVSH